MELLSVDNLMKSDNPILHRILQLLDLRSLEAYSSAINTYLWNSLNRSFDLYRKLKPFSHFNERQPPLRLYWKYKSYSIADSHRDNKRCKCRYCLDLKSYLSQFSPKKR